VSLPQKREREELKQHAPTGGLVHNGGTRRLLVSGDEGVKPENDSGDNEKVGVGGRHERRVATDAEGP
jgi:hypothetical protein